MIIAEIIKEQMREFTIMIACGFVIAIIFEIYEKNSPSFIGDIFFMTFAGFVVSAFWYKSSYVRISFHETAGIIIGLIVWKKWLGGQISSFLGNFYVIIIILVYMYYL